MRALSLLITLIGTLLSLSANARQTYCTGFSEMSFVSINNDPVKDVMPSPDYVCADFHAFESIAHQVKSLSRYRVGSTNIMATKRPLLDAAYDAQWGQIRLGFNTQSPKEVEHAKAVFMHEVGHAVFERALAEKIPLLKQYLILKTRSEMQMSLMTPVLERTSDESCSDPTSECGKFMKDYFVKIREKWERYGGDRITDDIRDFSRQNKVELDRVTALSSPFHELFGDLVATSLLKNPDAISNALSYFTKQDQACRSFSEELPADFNSPDPHCSLSKIRKQLWLSTRDAITNDQKRAKAIQNFAEVFATRVAELYRSGLLSISVETELEVLKLGFGQ